MQSVQPSGHMHSLNGVISISTEPRLFHMKINCSVSVQVLPVGHMQTVFPALYESANDLQIVAENGPLGVETMLHQEL